MIPDVNHSRKYSGVSNQKITDQYEEGRKRGRIEGVTLGTLLTIIASLIVFYVIP